MNLLNEKNFAFLNNIKLNNNRDWLEAHRNEYESSEDAFKIFCHRVEADLNHFDRIEKLKIYRIYRDVRFSKNKTPYKIHRSASWSRLGLERRGSYYFRIQPGNSFLAGGFFAPNKDDLLRIRQEFTADGDSIRNILKEKDFHHVFGDFQQDLKLKTAPRGFTIDHPNIELIRLKKYVVSHHFTDEEVLSKNFRDVVKNQFQLLQPFFNYMSDILTTNLNGESIL